MGIHQHRPKGSFSRGNKSGGRSSNLRSFGNEDFIFDERRESCRIEFELASSNKDRENQIFATFLNMKQTQIRQSYSGEEEYEQTPIVRLSRRQIKQRIKDYNHYNSTVDLEDPEKIKCTSALVAARNACTKKYGTNGCMPT